MSHFDVSIKLQVHTHNVIYLHKFHYEVHNRQRIFRTDLVHRPYIQHRSDHILQANAEIEIDFGT